MTTHFGEKSEYADVLARVRDWAEARDVPFDIWRPRWDLARETPGSMDRHNQMATLYMTQVLRAVRQLTDEGVLVSNGNTGRYAVWATPQVWARIKASAARDEAARAARKELWEQRAARFREMGWDVTVSPEDGSVTFPDSDAVRLLTRLMAPS